MILGDWIYTFESEEEKINDNRTSLKLTTDDFTIVRTHLQNENTIEKIRMYEDKIIIGDGWLMEAEFTFEELLYRIEFYEIYDIKEKFSFNNSKQNRIFIFLFFSDFETFFKNVEYFASAKEAIMYMVLKIKAGEIETLVKRLSKVR